MNAKIIKTQIVHKMKYGLRGHYRSQKVIIKSFVSVVHFLFNAKSFKNFSRMSTLWRHQFFIKWSMILKVIQGHKNFYAKIILAHSFMDRFWGKFVWKLVSIWWRHNSFIKLWPEMSLLCFGEESDFFYFKIFWPHYNLDLRSYGQLLSLFFL